MMLLKFLYLISCFAVGLTRFTHPRTRGDYSLPDLISVDEEFSRLELQKKHNITERNPWEEPYRLSRNVIPFHYWVQIRTDVHEGSRPFSGKVDLYFTVTEPTSSIYIHSRGLNLTKSELYAQPGNGSDEVLLEQLEHTTDDWREFILYDTQEELKVDQVYILCIEYTGYLRYGTDGLYMASYVNDGGLRRYFAATQFQPVSARSAFPCFDEPALKVTVDLSVIHHRSYDAVSNMPRISRETYDEDEGLLDYDISTFATTQRMSIYLLAILVSDFTYRSHMTIPEYITQSVYSRPNAINETEFALDAGVLTIGAMDTYTGIPYGSYMPKLGQVAIPGFDAGAMENWGLCKYGEQYLLFNPSISTFRQRTWISTIIAHEYIHQWFGNLVTNEWWSYLWLNEGFATLYEYYAAQLAFPEQEYFEMFNLDVVQWALDADSRDYTRPMSYSRGAGQYEISSLFDNVAYSKAGSVLNMFRNVLGDSVWQEMIHIYLIENELKPVNPGNLIDAMELAVNSSSIFPGNISISDFVHSWTDQTGYPVLEVRRNYELGDLILSQDRFFNNRIVNYDPTVWIVPYNIAEQTMPDFENLTWNWLTEKAARFPITASNESWIILNKQQTGFYRVNYDIRNWYLIIDALQSNYTSVHRLNRAQLLDDAFQLARSNRLDLEVVLDLMAYLQNELEYHPWTAASPIVSYFYNRLRGAANYDNYQRFVGNLISEVYSTLTIDDVADDESHLHKYLKQTISTWACTIGNTDCLNRTRSLLQETAERNGTIHPDIAAVTHCFGLRNSTQQAFTYLYDKMKASTDQTQRNMLIDALGCSNNPEHLNAFLMTSIGGDLQMNYTMSERNRVLYSVAAASRDGVDALIDFLIESHDYVIDILGSGALYSAVSTIAARTNNQDELDRLDDLIEALDNVVPSILLEIFRETAVQNLAWHSTRDGFIVSSFLERYS
ncbi:aminopeptidase N-like [Malaya genurostris]|uniref:aminopeptidase N-like n=1 Tax=Malaya genurostris TaxID=325434 RepID=UPI0026F3D88B|nr:aminopeptidase N-like [Malaya genurostris]